MLRQVTVDDIRPIAIGAGILGTGGGGNPYLGGLALGFGHTREGSADSWLTPLNWRMRLWSASSAASARQRSASKNCPRAPRCRGRCACWKSIFDRRFDAVAIAEIGGANSMQPLNRRLASGHPHRRQRQHGARLSRNSDVVLSLWQRRDRRALRHGGRRGQRRHRAIGCQRCVGRADRAQYRRQHGRPRWFGRLHHERRAAESLGRALYDVAGASPGYASNRSAGSRSRMCRRWWLTCWRAKSSSAAR